MKKILMAAVALTALGATPAMAAGVFTVSGDVAATCGAISDGTITFSSGIATGTDGTLTSGQSQSSAPQNVYCNGAGSKITVAHTAMKIGDGTGAPSNFTKTIDFTTDVNFAGTHFGEGTSQTLGAMSGSLVVSANDLTASAKPLAGSYSGSITVTVSPSL
ncbi:hypothetical protein [Sphingobium sp. EP60837]|uniref:hypothetical protein n=1 Tax=Sphingobium sp. EP60837 TaxID=1855519 RepID=UPI0007DDEA2D|nr:hypothetical protein [Sphingobium sp. EP60837]ANI79505.1 hypothetical protein EP837_03111 [Sphingobium sp. EP60837]